jgi:UDP-N-acetyl-D-galactosamine dehydrogenase
MGAYVAKETIKHIISTDKSLKQSNVLIMGATFKENVTDIRNSKVVDIYNELKSFSINIDVVDPHASSDELQHEYGFGLASDTNKKYDAVIVAVSHSDYINLNESYFSNLLVAGGLLVDIKGIYRKTISGIKVWSL